MKKKDLIKELTKHVAKIENELNMDLIDLDMRNYHRGFMSGIQHVIIKLQSK